MIDFDTYKSLDLIFCKTNDALDFQVYLLKSDKAWFAIASLLFAFLNSLIELTQLSISSQSTNIEFFSFKPL